MNTRRARERSTGSTSRSAPGEIYGFLGPNGAGKSTTVVLTTLLPPTAGTARVGGDVVKDGPKVRSLIGVALQEAALDPLLTGRDHLRLQATLQGVRKDQRSARARSCSTGSGSPTPPTGRSPATREA